MASTAIGALEPIPYTSIRPAASSAATARFSARSSGSSSVWAIVACMSAWNTFRASSSRAVARQNLLGKDCRGSPALDGQSDLEVLEPLEPECLAEAEHRGHAHARAAGQGLDA